MEINIKMNPSEAITAVNSGMLLGLLEVVHASESNSTDIIKAAQQPVVQAQDTYQQQIQPVIQQPVQQQPIQQYPTQQTGIPVQQMPVQSQVPQEQYQQPVQQQVQQAPTGVPTTATSYTMEQLAVAAQALMDAGRVVELRNLLANFNVPSLTALPKEQYGAFATQLREWGGKI
jgi:hypothetical protein